MTERATRTTRRRVVVRPRAVSRLAAVASAVLVALVALVAPAPLAAATSVPTTPASTTLSGSDFNPGMIISDGLFYDGSAMTADQIQSFLDRMIGTCENDQCLNVAVVPLDDVAPRVSRDTGERACDAITGGTLRVSELIYRAQVACGISAKVILVTLQKEQGLITNRAPSEYALRAAMGMACPDTAPCDAAFAGLARQIVSGTAQLKIYKVGRFARQPGVQYIQFHPNGECGGTNVNVLNYATAALYSYTPYQPNGASLANLGGTGDGCSTYGNRNFWRYYNSWFGSTTGVVDPWPDVETRYQTAGGAAGPLGAATGSRTCVTGASGCWQSYRSGLIGWTFGGGAFVVGPGVILDNLLANGGPSNTTWGYPISEQNRLSGPNGDGVGQNFQRVQVLSGTTGTFTVEWVIADFYGAAGWVRGPLGWPTGEAICRADACAQRFENGVLGRWKNGAFALEGDFLVGFESAGGFNGTWGIPVSAETALTGDMGSGSGQNFENVQVLRSAAGTFAVPNSISAVHASMGWVRSGLGWPTADAVCNARGCSQVFQGGLLSVNPDGRAFLVTGSILAAYESSGGASGPWGRPTSGENAIPGAVSPGSGQNFENVQVLSSTAGVFAVPNSVIDVHAANGWVRGYLGWPTAAAVCDASGCSQQFQGATITVPSNGSRPTIARSWAVTGSILAAYESSGGASGPWGRPTSGENAIPGAVSPGSGQNFENVQVLSSTAGVFAVPNSVIDVHAANGWVRGYLGWPTAAAVCDASGCSQQFQGATITVPSNGSRPTIARSWAVTGSILAAYESSGGASGPWGRPTSGENAIPGAVSPGSGQNFENVQVLSSTAGVFAVPNSVIDVHAANGWVRGYLGWPTAAAVCDASGCSQQFQGATITVPSNGSRPTIARSWAVTGSILAAYESSGGASGPWGRPTSGENAIPGAVSPGSGQNFENVQVLSSTAGVFAVPNSVIDVHAANGWVRGYLGWPTAAAVCDASGCSQQFQGATITVPSNGSQPTITRN